MKKFALTAIAAAMFSTAAVAADSHTRWEGSVEKFTGTITNKAQFDDLIKYTDYKTQANLKAAFADGKLTAEEIKDSGISDHHFYTGLLASAKSQTEYDKYLKQLNNGANVDDNFVSNRDLKAAGSMIMNQVDAGNKVQDVRTDKIVSGLKDLGDYIVNNTPKPEVQPDIDESFGQGHLPDNGQGEPADPEVDEDFGQGHVPDYGQDHLPPFGQGEAIDPEVDDNFGQSHVPDYGRPEGDVDQDFGQGHLPDNGQGEALDPEVDEDFGQGHVPDYGQDGDIDRPFPGQGDRPQPQPDVDEDFGQGHLPDHGQGEPADPEVDNDFGVGHLPDNGQSNGNSGEIERPRPGNGEGSVERPQPGNGQGSVERPLPGAGSSVDRPRPEGDNGSNGGSGGDIERPRPVEPDNGNSNNGQVHRPTPGLGGAVANNGNNIATNAGNIQNNANNIESNKNNIASMGDAFQDRVDNVNGWLTQMGTGITNNSDKIDGLAGAFQAQAAHNTKEIARLDGRIDALEEKTDKMKAGIAGAHAVASLTQYHGVGQHHVAVGIGSYDGEAAIAAGYTYAFDDKKTTIRGTFAIDTESEFAVGASIGHSW